MHAFTLSGYDRLIAFTAITLLLEAGNAPIAEKEREAMVDLQNRLNENTESTETRKAYVCSDSLIP